MAHPNTCVCTRVCLHSYTGVDCVDYTFNLTTLILVVQRAVASRVEVSLHVARPAVVAPVGLADLW